MKTLFYLHWNKQELKERVKALKGLKLKIYSHWSTETTAKWGENLPDIFIISLDRLPSHGKQYAEWLWEAKKRQHIPLIFVGGKPEKLEQFIIKFPKAIFCSDTEELYRILTKLITNKNE